MTKYVKLFEEVQDESLTYYSDILRHIICVPYSVTNLHRMAKDLGIDRAWYEAKPYPHYDIPKKRIAEIQARTTVIKSTELLKKIKGEG